jgi:protein PET100
MLVSTNTYAQFGVYIMFPIGWMYYFGANLEERFSIPDFWPKENETHHIPFEKDEIQSELARLRARRLAVRQRRAELEGNAVQSEQHDVEARPSPILESLRHNNNNSTTDAAQSSQPDKENNAQSSGWLSWLK